MTVAESCRGWLQRFPQEPADRRVLALAAIDAFESCEHDPQATGDRLEPLRAAAGSSHKLVFETGARLLARLAVAHSAARDLLLAMSRDKSATPRFHAVAFLTDELPDNLRLEIVHRALHDRSEKILRKGIERAEEFRFLQFLPRLEELQRRETRDKVRRSLALHLPLLRDGYRLEPSEDGGGHYLTFRTREALTTKFLWKEEYSEEAVRQEIARLLSNRQAE